MDNWNVADQLAIRNLYAAYTYAVDDHDGDAFAACFTPDGEVELGGWESLRELIASGALPFLNAQGRAIGSENLKAIIGIMPPGTVVLHLTSNVWIMRLDGDEAEAQAAFCVFADDGIVEHYGRYKDKLKRCADGRWRFSERRDVGRYERKRPAFGRQDI